MKFSIIIPAYNEEKYIVKCLRAVYGMRIPEGDSREIIVVDNASTDRTFEIVRDNFPKVKLVKEPRKGLTIAYNRGAKEADGDIFMFIDADDFPRPHHLEKFSKQFKKHQDLICVSGPCVYTDSGLAADWLFRLIFIVLAMPAEMFFNRLLNVGASIASGNSAIRKEYFRKSGGFNEELFYGLEADFTKRVRKLGKVRFKYSLWVETSGRRFRKEGALKMLLKYILNIVWPYIFKKPFTKEYIDIR